MSAIFTGRDLIEIAVEAKRRGITLYSCLAGSLSSAKARELFARISHEEEDHLAELRRLLDTEEMYHPNEPYPDSYYDYLKALFDHWAVPAPEACAEIATAVRDAAQACPLASALEKRVILLLHEMRRFVPEDKHGTLQRLLEGEYEHVRHLHALEQSQVS
jgi:rubrerythrin